MGSSSSRLGSPPSEAPRANGFKRTLSSLFICGASTSTAPFQMDDDRAESLVKSAECNGSIISNIKRPGKELSLTSGTGDRYTSPKIAASSESNVVISDNSSSENRSGSIGKSTEGKCSSESIELFPNQLTGYMSNNRASTSTEDRDTLDSSFSNGMVDMDFANGTNDIMDRDVSQICSGITQSNTPPPQEHGDFSPDRMSDETHESEVTNIHNSDTGNAPVHSYSPRDETPQEEIPFGLGFLAPESEQDERDGGNLHADVIVSSNNFPSGPSGNAEISTRDSRRNSRRLFWDALSRRNTRRHNDSRSFIFSTDDYDDLGSHDRWLFDFGGDSLDNGLRRDARFLEARSHNINERRRHSRSEIWDRLRGGIDGSNHRTNVCPSGRHPDGTCSCESILMAEESGPHARISRIVMLAEALFEVLDEIHRQPVSLSLSMASLPAPESVVDSLPVKNHTNSHTSETDVEQCYICLAEYKEGDKIRVLPCHHEYHMSCVDKWLKEIHGVCPLCRGDVAETQASVSTPEIPSA